MLEPAFQSLLEWLDAFSDPKKRVFWGYLALAFTLGFFWMTALRGESKRKAIAKIFAPSVWWSMSARADYLLMIVNGVVMTLLSPRLLGQTAVAYFLFEHLHALVGGRPGLASQAPEWAVALGFTLCLFVLDDFAKYWVHRWLHTVPCLWLFHRVHHSASVLNPLTVFRTHPVEAVLFGLRSALVQGVTVASFFFYFGDKVSLMTVLGANAFTFAFNVACSNLRHSNLPLGFWRPVECVFISPAQHQLHHSYAREHLDRNFGVVFAVWDWTFGSHCHSVSGHSYPVGLGPTQSSSEHSLVALYVGPFVALVDLVCKSKVVQALQRNRRWRTAWLTSSKSVIRDAERPKLFEKTINQ